MITMRATKTRHNGQRALAFLMPRAAAARSNPASFPIWQAFSFFHEQEKVATGGKCTIGGNIVPGVNVVTGGNIATGGNIVNGDKVAIGGKVAFGRAATALFGARAARTEYGSLRRGRSCTRRSWEGPFCRGRSLLDNGCTSLPLEHGSSCRLSSSSALVAFNGSSRASSSLVNCANRRVFPSASLVGNDNSRAFLLTYLATDDNSRLLSSAPRVSAGSRRAVSSTSPTTDGSSDTSDSMVSFGSRRGFPSASLASDGRAISVVKQGTESFLVAQRNLAAGDVLFNCTPGTLSSVRSRHSIQVAADLHLTVSDDLQLINHGCTPNCQLELVDSSSTAGKGPCVRVTVIAPEILKGETLTIDYNAMEVDIISSFDCACGAVNCRGHISGFSKLPPSVQEEYIQGRWLTSQVGTEGSGVPPLLTGVVKDWVATTRRVRGS